MSDYTEFDEIRPYLPEELPAVFDELIADPLFRKRVEGVILEPSFEEAVEKMRGCKSGLDFQKAFCCPILAELARRCSDGIDMDATAIVDKQESHTFITNHRDIVLDSAFLSMLLLDEGFPTTVEIAIGDNLLIHPWIERLVRINKSFIVKRSVGVRGQLLASMRLGRYIHYAVGVKNENVWIAQREGRSKDSTDKTQDAILKMMAMGGEGSVVERLKAIRIAPLAISYEYDPCDYLKAKEFQQKRDNPDFKKSPADDMANMFQGIWGYKGRIHYQMTPCMNEWLDSLDEANLSKNELFRQVALRVDHEIHRSYAIYPGNYVAADLLTGDQGFTAYYTHEDKARFESYMATQLAKIELEHRDEEFLTRCFLTMYANPLFNYMAATRDEVAK